MDYKPNYRFKFEIVDETTGDTIEGGSTYLSGIDAYGRCESVEMEVAQRLRNFETRARDDHERGAIIDHLTSVQEDLLKEAHADDMPDAFEAWLENISLDELKVILKLTN